MTKWTHVKSRQRSAAGVNISSKKRKAKTDREYQQRQKQIRELERRHKPLKIKLKRCDINRVRSKETIDDNIERTRITQLNTNNDAMDMDINDVPICDAEIQFTQSTQPTDIRWTMSKRTTDTANIKDYSVSFADVLRDKLFAIKALFTTVNLINHPDILPAIGYNKHLETGIQLMIVDFTSMNGEESSNQTDLSAVLGNAKTILRRNNIGLNELNDKYMQYVLGLDLTQLERIVRQLQGMYFIVHADMNERFKIQTDDAPRSMLTTNDICESLNGTGKYNGERAPNISPGHKAGMALGELNKDCWYTFEWIAKFKPKLFKHIIMMWYSYNKSFRKAYIFKNTYQKQYHRYKWQKMRVEINGSTRVIPSAKQRRAQRKKVIVINTQFRNINSRLWKRWTRERDLYLYRYKGIGLRKQRSALKTKLKQQLQWYRMNTNGGLEALQQKLYEHCVQHPHV
eukprot:304507_1